MRQVFRVSPTDHMGAFEARMVREFPALVRSYMERAGRDGCRLLQFMSYRIHDLGSFRVGWRYSVYSTRMGSALDFYNKEYHAVFVLKGRRAGARMPPHQPIFDWVMRHIGDERAVFPIRRAIARRGIAARPVLEIAAGRLTVIVDRAHEEAWQTAASMAARGEYA